MGFFSNLFSKQECSFCSNKVGALSRKKLHDGNYICKECEKNCSAFIDPARFDTEYIKYHMEYMKKQDVLYKKEFVHPTNIIRIFLYLVKEYECSYLKSKTA